MAADTGLQFDFEWRTCLAVALLLPLLLSLGFWQLDRADEKLALQAVFEARKAAAAAPLGDMWDASPEQLAYTAVEVHGRYLPEYDVLLDNQMYQRHYGFHLLSVLELEDGRIALVNRGWMPGDPARRTLPQISYLPGEVRLRATVYVPPGEAFVLEADQLEAWPQLIQSIDMEALQSLLPHELFPYTLRLAAGEPGAEVIDWPVVNVSPEKHTGYAVQWFAMAAALLIVFVFASSNLRQVLSGRRGS